MTGISLIGGLAGHLDIQRDMFRIDIQHLRELDVAAKLASTLQNGMRIGQGRTPTKLQRHMVGIGVDTANTVLRRKQDATILHLFGDRGA